MALQVLTWPWPDGFSILQQLWLVWVGPHSGRWVGEGSPVDGEYSPKGLSALTLLGLKREWGRYFNI